MISRVCRSSNAAETRAFDITSDEGVFVAQTVAEIYKGNKNAEQIPVIMLCDSQGLKDSLESTKKVEEKMMRPTVQSLKDLITFEQIKEFWWVSTVDCLADVLTKKDTKMMHEFMEIVKSGDLKRKLGENKN